MDAHTFMRSLFALRRYFVEIAELGAQHAHFEALEHCGIGAEARMLAATGGINHAPRRDLHVGIAVRSGRRRRRDRRRATPSSIRSALLTHWARRWRRARCGPLRLPGGQAAQRHGLRTAGAEAALGFPSLFETAAPALAAAQTRGLGATAGAPGDTVPCHRGARRQQPRPPRRPRRAALRPAAARGFLAAGGAAQREADAAAAAIGTEFVRASPVARRRGRHAGRRLLAAAHRRARGGAMSFALVFAGQGTQHPAMLPWLARTTSSAAPARRWLSPTGARACRIAPGRRPMPMRKSC
jgi:triphosphoribosyl-dephospho-CoA synthase